MPKNARIRSKNKALVKGRNAPRRVAQRQKQKRPAHDPPYYPAPSMPSIPDVIGPNPAIPHGDVVVVDPPPTPPLPPEPIISASPTLATTIAPDRPLSSGVNLEAKADFESAFPTGWAQNTSGSATLTRPTNSGLTGTGYMRSLKASGGSLSSANLSKVFSPPAGLEERNDSAVATKHKAAVLPNNGSVVLQELRRPSDLARFAWAELSNVFEQTQLDILGGPTTSGTISITTDDGGTAINRTTSVTAVKEVRSLTINNAQTAPGDVVVTLANAGKSLSLGGARKEVFQFIVKGSTPVNHTMKMNYVNSVGASTYVSIPLGPGWTPEQIASAIRFASYDGWTNSGSGATVIWTRNVFEDVPNVFANGSYHTTSFFPTDMILAASWSTLVQGAVALTAIGVADLLRATSFPGWTPGGTSGTATVSFTAIEPGPKTGTLFGYSAGSTGATSTSGLTQTTAGVQTTPSAIATAVRALFAGNTFWSAGGTGAQVLLTALATGSKQDATFSVASTGVQAQIQTPVQGGAGVTAYCRDSNGVTRKRRVMSNLATSTIFNLETAVSGAGVDDAEAIVSVWGSFGTDPKVLLARFEGIDLSAHPAGAIAYGVISESASGLTWDVYTDEVQPTNRGQSYYRDHNAKGQLLPQVFGYFRLLPEQARQDLLLQQDEGQEQPILPGMVVAAGVFLRIEDVPTALSAKPIFITAIHADGTTSDIRDVTGASGISGTAGWAEYTYTFTVPVTDVPIVALRFNSRDISRGTFVIQEVVFSPGTIVDRSYQYATSGTVRMQLAGGAPNEAPYVAWDQERIALETFYDAPAGTAVVPQYRSTDDEEVWFPTWYTDPDDVDDLQYIQVEAVLTGDSGQTPVIRVGSPRLEYGVKIGEEPLSLLLQENRTEFEGGVLIQGLEEWFYNEDDDIQQLVSGRVKRQSLHEPVGLMPSFSLMAFRPNTVKYLQHMYARKHVAELRGEELLVIKILARPAFKRITRSREHGTDRHAYWRADGLAAEVWSVAPLAPLASLAIA